MTRHGVGPRREQVGGQTAIKSQTLFFGERMLDQNRLNAVIVEKLVGFSCLGGVALAAADVRDLVPLGEAEHQMQGTQALARGWWIGDVAVDNSYAHKASACSRKRWVCA